MLRGSNAVIGGVNFATFLISIPILGGAIWLSARANSGECLRFLQWPLLAISLSLMAISLAGFAGACYRITWLLRLYLLAMSVLILALLSFVIFAFAVTDRGSGQPVLGRAYFDYHLSDYSGWLRDRVSDPRYWSKISSCLRERRACRGMPRYVRFPATGVLVPETPEMFYQRELSPVESGCCKPPTSCGFTYVNETAWNPVGGAAVEDADCTRWSNDQKLLCFRCDSCRAGVLATLKRSWRKVSIINVVVLILLVLLYAVAIAAFHNNKRLDNGEPYDVGGMTKSRPSRFHF